MLMTCTTNYGETRIISMQCQEPPTRLGPVVGAVALADIKKRVPTATIKMCPTYGNVTRTALCLIALPIPLHEFLPHLFANIPVPMENKVLYRFTPKKRMGQDQSSLGFLSRGPKAPNMVGNARTMDLFQTKMLQLLYHKGVCHYDKAHKCMWSKKLYPYLYFDTRLPDCVLFSDLQYHVPSCLIHMWITPTAHIKGIISRCLIMESKHRLVK